MWEIEYQDHLISKGKPKMRVNPCEVFRLTFRWHSWEKLSRAHRERENQFFHWKGNSNEHNVPIRRNMSSNRNKLLSPPSPIKWHSWSKDEGMPQFWTSLCFTWISRKPISRNKILKIQFLNIWWGQECKSPLKNTYAWATGVCSKPQSALFWRVPQLSKFLGEAWGTVIGRGFQKQTNLLKQSYFITVLIHCKSCSSSIMERKWGSNKVSHPVTDFRYLQTWPRA